MDALNSGQQNIRIEHKLFDSAKSLMGEVDVLTNDEFIEVKAGGSYSDAKKLSDKDFKQFDKYRSLFKGTRVFYDEFSNKFIPLKNGFISLEKRMLILD